MKPLILILSSHLCLCLSHSLLVSYFKDFQLKVYMFLISPVPVTCPTYLILLDLIILIVTRGQYKL